MRVVLCCVLLLPLVAVAGPTRAPPTGDVLLPPAIGTPLQVRIEGRVVTERARGSNAVSRNLRRLLNNNVPGAEVVVEFAGQVAVTRSVDDGHFEVTFTAPRGVPFFAGELPVRARAGRDPADSKVFVASDEPPFLVVSDFDDTVALSGVTSKRSLAKTTLLHEAETQPPVAGMGSFYRCLVEGRSVRPPIAFVTGSPIQFLDRLEKFLDLNGFPFAGLLLRDVGPRTLSNYKQPAIRRLLTQFVLPVVLVGDSGEADPEVYAQVAREFPGRVLRTYIRDAGRPSLPSRFEGMQLFVRAREAAQDAASRGLADPACVSRAFPSAE